MLVVIANKRKRNISFVEGRIMDAVSQDHQERVTPSMKNKLKEIELF
jgi:hypothetical protein